MKIKELKEIISSMNEDLDVCVSAEGQLFEVDSVGTRESECQLNEIVVIELNV